MPKKFANELYRLGCTEAYLWLVKAAELSKSANLLWVTYLEDLAAFQNGESIEEPFIGSTALMLYGLVIENLMKAGLTHSGQGINSSQNFSLKSHNLIELGAQLKISFSREETELLERLENFVSWAGRYPVPLLAEDLYPRQMEVGGQYALHGVSSLDVERVGKIIEKVKMALPTEEEAILRYVNNYKA